MKVVFLLIIYLWSGCAVGWSEEPVQEPVPPVTRDAEDTNKTRKNSKDNPNYKNCDLTIESARSTPDRKGERENEQCDTNTKLSKWADPLNILTALPRTFLVKTEWFFHDEPKPTHIDMARVEKGEINCFLYGYVDYRDGFGGRHRVGFARVYDPKRDSWNEYDSRESFEKRSNLVFVSQDGYSYDEARKKGTGNDW